MTRCRDEKFVILSCPNFRGRHRKPSKVVGSLCARKRLNTENHTQYGRSVMSGCRCGVTTFLHQPTEFDWLTLFIPPVPPEFDMGLLIRWSLIDAAAFLFQPFHLCTLNATRPMKGLSLQEKRFCILCQTLLRREVLSCGNGSLRILRMGV
jgi:hypothetical protein